MNRPKWLTLIVPMSVLVLAMTGCGLVSPVVRLATELGQTPTPRVVEKPVVATPAPARPVKPAEAAPTAAPPVTIEIPAGSDVETQIYTAVYRKVNPSVVYIENLTQISQDPRSQSSSDTLASSSGSGFVWDAAGHIITNEHVVQGADALRVVFSDGVTLPAKVVGVDADSDVAVIKVDPSLVALTPVEQGQIDEVAVGQRAIAIGNPFGLVGSMTTGIVSAIGRSVESQTQYNIPLVIQTDAAINPGNSGGPLLDEKGRVIGINFQIASSAGVNSGVGFAIPINIVQRVAPALIADGVYRHAYLGISGNTYSPAWAEALGFPTDARGAYVLSIVKGGPSEKAGIQAGSEPTNIALGVSMNGTVYLPGGGDLIIGIDDRTVKSFDDILIYLESYKSPGETVTLTLLRPGKGEVQAKIKLGERPHSQ